VKSLSSGLPRLILYLALAMIVAGIVLHGISYPVFERIWNNLLDRPAGPLTFRFLLQPAMSTIFGVRDGIRDAKLERRPYFWTILTDPPKAERGCVKVWCQPEKSFYSLLFLI